MTVIIYHNPRCGKSRDALKLIEAKGIAPQIVEYLKSPPDAEGLRHLLGLLNMTPRALMRIKEAKEAGLDDADLTDEQLIAGMVANPIVIERPIVVADGKAVIGRPPETVLTILEG